MTYAGEDASDEWERRRGKSVGVKLLGALSEGFVPQMQAEARYVQKGARAEIQQGDLVVTDRLHYFDAALLGRLPLPLSRTAAPFLLGGLSGNVGFGGTREVEGPGGTVTETLDPSSDTQWSLVFGAGIDIGRFSTVSLTLDTRYVYGLNSAPTEGIGDIEGAAFRNQGFMLNAGLAFSL